MVAMLCTTTFSSTTPASQVSTPIATTIAVTLTTSEISAAATLRYRIIRIATTSGNKISSTRVRAAAPTSLVAANAAAWPTR